MKIIQNLKPSNKIEFILCIWFVLLSVLSIFLGTRESLLYENLTFIGNQPRYQLLFQTWGIVVSLNYLVSFLYLNYTTKVGNKVMDYMAWILAILNIASFFIPYNIKEYSFLSNIHVITSLLSSIGTFLMIQYFIHKSETTHPYPYNTSVRILQLFLLFFFTILIALGDISGLSEVVMAIFLSGYFYYLIKSYNFT